MSGIIAEPPPRAIASLEMAHEVSRRHGLWLVAAGVVTIAVAEIGLFTRTPPFPHWFFVFAWYGWILFCDGWLLRLEGRSLLISRGRELALMLVLSAICWSLFEVLNIRLRNWQYHDLINPLWLRLIGFALAFATVFPALFLTADLLRAIAVRRNWRVASWRIRPVEITRELERRLFWTGVAFLILPMLWPKVFFPLVWLALVPMLEPWNRRRGMPSLYDDLQRGDPRRIVLLLLAGFICGGLWEFWNFWAVSKWSYTIPYVGFLKIFEMPVLGFFGFPPFTLECFAMYYFCMSLKR